MDFQRQDIAFSSDGDCVRGWLYTPRPGSEPWPAIVMAHGFGAVKEMYLDRFAESFAAAGFAVLLFDYRRLGASDGVPRQEIDPATQIEDYRNAMTWIAAQEEVDAERIGIWGTSYSGGHVLIVAATDPRVKCVVSQVPTISGNAVAKRRFTPDKIDDSAKANAQDRLARMQGAAPKVWNLVPHGSGDPAVYSAPDAVEWYTNAARRGGGWRNEVTLRSLEYSRAYEPGAWVSFISPCPLLMIVADRDAITPTDLALGAYEQARQPKRLEMIRGGHFEAYTTAFDTVSGAARDWFVRHLL
ncbi:alpha/beta hydrolase [Marinovum sp.]|uniref:alpha/beta hydrolase n=1 Tax=Marinovum sp. TaxID=2024839 RepID=UPI002B2724BF|nr:alpha/beta hydrolase [Marinovum sp.]